MLSLGLSFSALALRQPLAPPGPRLHIASGHGHAGSTFLCDQPGPWFADDQPIAGETGSAWTMTKALEGAAIRCGASNVIQVDAPGPAALLFDLNFATDSYQALGLPLTAAEVLSHSRASVKNIADSSGLFSPRAANILPRSDLGLLIEGTRTNRCLRSRELNHALWLRSGLSASRDQPGIDGAAGTATLLTATSPGGTITQSITATGANYWPSFFLRRISGTGALEGTLNGSDWYPLLEGEPGRWFISFAPGLHYLNIANPVIGLRLATPGDQILVDAVQLENSAVGASSPIYTTSAALSRAADSAQLSPALTALTSMRRGTILAEITHMSMLRAIGTYPQVVNARLDAQNKLGIEINGAGQMQGFLPYKDSQFLRRPWSAGLMMSGSRMRIAASWGGGYALARFTGGEGGIEANGYERLPDIAPLAIGLASNNGGQQGFLYLSRLVWFSDALPETALAAWISSASLPL